MNASPPVVVVHDRFPEETEWPWTIQCKHCGLISPGWVDEFSAQAGGYYHLRQAHPEWNDNSRIGTRGTVVGADGGPL